RPPQLSSDDGSHAGGPMQTRARWTMGAVALLFAILAGVAAADSPAETEKQLRALLSSLEGAKTPEDRREIVRALAKAPSIRAAEKLRKIAKSDPDPALRVEAVQGLGASPVPEALDMLLDFVVEGGTRQVRRAVGRAI